MLLTMLKSFPWYRNVFVAGKTYEVASESESKQLIAANLARKAAKGEKAEKDAGKPKPQVSRPNAPPAQSSPANQQGNADTGKTIKNADGQVQPQNAELEKVTPPAVKPDDKSHVVPAMNMPQQTAPKAAQKPVEPKAAEKTDVKTPPKKDVTKKD